jgi:hypothetical protein
MAVMNTPQEIALSPEEQVLFTSDRAVLTNDRLFVNDRKNKNSNNDFLPGWTAVNVSDVVVPTLKNGGKASRKELGARIFTVGVGLILVQVIPYTLLDVNWLASLGGLFESMYFMVSMMGTVVGAYFLLGTYLNPRPHTSVLFENPGEKSIIVIFDGWDSKEAEELRRAFVRIRRLT